MGYRVTAIKIDPYLNVDAGTMVRMNMRSSEHFSSLTIRFVRLISLLTDTDFWQSPFEHGEGTYSTTPTFGSGRKAQSQ